MVPLENQESQRLLWIPASGAMMTTMGASHSLLKPEGLRSGQIHIWPVQLTAREAARERYWSFLCPEERDRATRFQFPRLRDAFTLSRGALRLLLGSYLRCLPEEVAFVYGEKGKPSLAGASPVRFNTSHSGSIAVFAFALQIELGVDVEQLRPMDDLQGISARFFSAPEIADLESLGPGDRVAGFFRCWTRKEAYIKATGNGLSAPLDSFRVTLLPGQTPQLTELSPSPTQEIPWFLHNLDLAPGYAAALAYQGEKHQIESSGLLGAEQLFATFEAAGQWRVSGQ